MRGMITPHHLAQYPVRYRSQNNHPAGLTFDMSSQKLFLLVPTILK
jgi:hypothetical protein